MTDAGPSETGVFTFMGTSNRTVDEILSRTPAASDKDNRSRVQAFIRDYLANRNGEALAAEVIAAGADAGLSEGVIKNARARAGVTTDRIDGAWLWSLADFEPASGTP